MTSSTPGVTGAHDVGGLAELQHEPLDLKEHDYKHWESQVHALQLELVRQGLLTVDEMRRAIEGLTPQQQQQLTYYEKWAAALTTICIERGTLTQAELEQELGLPAELPTHSRFQAGDVVRVNDEASAVAVVFRKPHLRTPGYIHGVIGVVERPCQGLFTNPEASAFRHPAPKQPMYRVRFQQLHVWEGYTGGEHDEVDVEVYEPWLAPATQQELDAQHAASLQRRTVIHAHAATSDAHHDTHHHHHHHHSHHDGVHHHHHHHIHEGGQTEPHVHEARGHVEQAAVNKEGEEDAERRRLPEALVRALTKKGVVTAEALRKGVEVMDARGRSGAGARLVARAWTDPAFKQRLLQDASAAAAELGIIASVYPTAAASGRPPATTSAAAIVAPTVDSSGTGPFLSPPQDPAQPCPLPVKAGTLLTVVENTPQVHNLVVCTLCSCYPIAVLGMSPSWYKSRAYRARCVRNPRAVLQEFGTQLPDGVAVRVHDSTADNRYLVLPMRPTGTEGWTEEQLQAIITRDTMIGVAVPVVPTSPAAVPS